jgi:DNA-binding transcriptional regulator YhcF (GntR family)
MKFFDLVKAEVADTVAELKENGVDTEEIHQKIESIYAEKSNIIQKLGKTPTAVAAKKKLSAMMQSTKRALKK